MRWWKRIVMTSRSESHRLDNIPDTQTNVTRWLATLVTARCAPCGSAWQRRLAKGEGAVGVRVLTFSRRRYGRALAPVQTTETASQVLVSKHIGGFVTALPVNHHSKRQVIA